MYKRCLTTLEVKVIIITMLSKHSNKNLHFSNRVVFVFAAIASVPLIALFSFIIAIMHGRAVSGLESMCERVLETNVKRVNELIDTCSVVEKTLYVNSDMMFFLSSLKFREEEEIIDFIREENQTVERIISVIPKIYSIRIFSSGPGFLERFPVFLNERREDLPALSKWEFNYSADFYGPRTSLWQPSACKTIEIKNGRQHIGYMQVAIRMEDFFPFLAQRNSIWEKDFVFIKKEDQTGSFSLSQISLENSAPELLEKDDLENFTKAIAAGKEGKTCRVYIKGKRNIVSWVEHKELGIIMAHTCSIQMILQSILFMVFFSLLGLILVIACFYCIIRFTSNRMFNGIYSVMQGMKEVKGGNLSVQIPVSGWPEVMETQQTFNSMTQQLSSQIEQIKKSIEQFGFNDPIAVWRDNEVIEGHGRLQAVIENWGGGYEIPIIRLDSLSEEQRRAYMLVHNRLTMNSGFDIDLLNMELDGITDFDMADFGFDASDDWFDTREKWDRSKQDGNDSYNEFLEKFEEKKTTDDCYTPDNIYDVVADWVAEEYALNREEFVRPFYPGGDYQSEDYDGLVVVDNPPFSILSKIIDFYQKHGVKFWLFAPSLTCLSGRKHALELNHIICDTAITYENGAEVRTSFVTNLDTDGTVLEANPELSEIINAKNDELKARGKVKLPKYVYPDHVITAAKAQWFAAHGTAYKLNARDCCQVFKLDAMGSKGIFGGGLLLNDAAAAERAAAERAAAERAAAHKWQLSERELKIVEMLNKQAGAS